MPLSLAMQRLGLDPSLPVLTVSQLTRAIKLQLETTFPLVFLEGEVSNCKVQSSGHIYFSLKDQDAQVQAVIFRGQASKLLRPPKDGDHVLVKGELNVYPPRGNYQIIVHELSLVGVGALLQELEERKKRLRSLGWFAEERKKALPAFPKKIGVITSPTGAVIQDILQILTRRAKGFHLLLYPVKVQGEGAAEEIAAAIREMNRTQLVDVMIVGRGGGSIEDLWAFNEEVVAEAIFSSSIPIVSAVGHETDFSLADFVADVRAPTPSAAAEIVTREQGHILQSLAEARSHLNQALRQRIFHERRRLDGILKQPLLRSPMRLLADRLMRLEDRRSRLDRTLHDNLKEKQWILSLRRRELHSHAPFPRMHRYREKLRIYWQAISQAERVFLLRRREKLTHLSEMMQAISPLEILKKGYSILFSEKEGFIIKSIESLKPKQKAFLTLNDGDALISIEEIYSRDERKKR